MRKQVIFDRKTGVVGIKRLATKKEEKEFGGNYVVDILDPINFHTTKTVQLVSPDYDWLALPKEDPRVRFIKLFDAIYGADWYYGIPEHCEVDEAYIENPHDVFEQIRKIFEA